MPERIAGRPCLDFVNTVDPRSDRTGHEYLTDFDAVLDWCAVADIELPRAVSWLRRAARADPAAAVAAHRRVLTFREALYDALLAAIDGRPAPRSAVEQVNSALGEGIGHRILAPAARGGVREAWRSATDLDQVLWPVAIDAWDLLTEPELTRVRRCPVDAGGCGWLFLDTSRSGNRRWCDMRTCGNRAKVRAHYERHAR
jgi:predicted RNA-binding Zn ribbon-like protein